MSDVSEKISLLVIGSRDDVVQSIEKFLVLYNDEIEFLGCIPTAQEGIDKAKTLKPHFILVDGMTPDMNSIEVVRLLRVDVPDTKIITMSTSNNPEWIVKGLEAGADDYICQPILNEDLYNQINKLHHHTGISLREELNNMRKGLL